MLDAVAKLIELAGPKPQVVVAFSGGIDSSFLAYALVRQRRKLGALRLCHVDHGLQAPSRQWSEHCARVARGWHVPFVSLRADIQRRRGDSPEAAARDARYSLLAHEMKPGEVLVTAQHRDDQVETVLLQLFRGAGVAGLAAMPSIASFGPGRIARPLLDTPRADIEAAARKAKLNWIEDPTNAELRYSRNFLRLRLMPLIREHWQGVDRALARTAANMAEADALLAQRAANDLAAAADGRGLNVCVLRTLTAARRRNVLRAFIARAGVEMPEASRLREMAGPLLAARADTQPEVHWANACLRRRSGRLELETSREPRPEMTAKSWRCHDDHRLILDNGDVFELIDDAAGAIDLDLLPQIVEVRARAGGEKLRPGLRARTKELKALLQAAKVPLDERARMPLVFAGDQLIAAGDRWIDASVAANVKSRRRGRLQWRRTD